MTTLTVCVHCGAIRDDSPFCAICRKSPLEAVDEIATEPEIAADEPHQRVSALTATVGIIAVLTLIWAWTRSDEAPPDAPALPTPTTIDPSFRSDGTAPSVAGGPPTTAPSTGSVVAGSDTTDNGLAPWETLGTEYGRSQEHLSAVLEGLPSVWAISDAASIGDLEEEFDIAENEATRPFVARSITHATLGSIGQVWIINADPDDPPGVAFVREAQTHTDDTAVAERIDAGPGIDLVRLDSDPLDIWVARYETPTQVTFFVRRGTDPTVLLAFLEDWRVADLRVS